MLTYLYSLPDIVLFDRNLTQNYQESNTFGHFLLTWMPFYLERRVLGWSHFWRPKGHPILCWSLHHAVVDTKNHNQRAPPPSPKSLSHWMFCHQATRIHLNIIKTHNVDAVYQLLLIIRFDIKLLGSKTHGSFRFVWRIWKVGKISARLVSCMATRWLWVVVSFVTFAWVVCE